MRRQRSTSSRRRHRSPAPTLTSSSTRMRASGAHCKTHCDAQVAGTAWDRREPTPWADATGRPQRHDSLFIVPSSGLLRRNAGRARSPRVVASVCQRCGVSRAGPTALRMGHRARRGSTSPLLARPHRNAPRTPSARAALSWMIARGVCCCTVIIVPRDHPKHNPAYSANRLSADTARIIPTRQQSLPPAADRFEPRICSFSPCTRNHH